MSKLTIWVQKDWLENPKVQECIAKGHNVKAFPDCEPDNPDLILHPNAWRWDDGKWEFLEVALKEARKGQPKRTPAKAGPKPRGRKGPKGTAG